MCTLERHGRVYLLTLTGAGEHRLNPTLLSAVRAALARVRFDAASSGGGAALVTAAEGKFFSNGFDLAWAKASPSDRPRLMSDALRLTVADLLSLPMPTIAAVTGHAAAGGCFLALSHDYVVMRADRGFLYMSEIDIGVPITEDLMALLRTKIPDPKARRDMLLQGTKLTAAEAARRGIVDRAVGGAEGEVVKAAVAMAEELAARKWDGEVYASIRKGAFREACRAVGLPDDEEEVIKKAASKL